MKEASRGAEAQRVTVNSTGCGFVPHSRMMKYLFKLTFSFLRSGVQAKRGADFRHLTRNASRTRWNVGNGLS